MTTLSIVTVLVLSILSWWIVGSSLAWGVLLILGVPLVLLLLMKLPLVKGATDSALKALLAVLGVGSVLILVLLGNLASRLNINLASEVYDVSKDKVLLVGLMKVSNVGNNNVGVEKAELEITAFREGRPLAQPVVVGTDELQFSPRQKDRLLVALGLDSPEYYITWGTNEQRQIAKVMPRADYYTVALLLVAKQQLSNSSANWRTSTTVSLKQKIGSSPSIPEEKEKDSSGILQGLIKGVMGERGK